MLAVAFAPSPALWLAQVEDTVADVYHFMESTNTIMDEPLEDVNKSPLSSLPSSVKSTPRGLLISEASEAVCAKFLQVAFAAASVSSGCVPGRNTHRISVLCLPRLPCSRSCATAWCQSSIRRRPSAKQRRRSGGGCTATCPACAMCASGRPPRRPCSSRWRTQVGAWVGGAMRKGCIISYKQLSVAARPGVHYCGMCLGASQPGVQVCGPPPLC